MRATRTIEVIVYDYGKLIEISSNEDVTFLSPADAVKTIDELIRSSASVANVFNEPDAKVYDTVTKSGKSPASRAPGKEEQTIKGKGK